MRLLFLNGKLLQPSEYGHDEKGRLVFVEPPDGPRTHDGDVVQVIDTEYDEREVCVIKDGELLPKEWGSWATSG